ncbi:hypothetical protein C8J56DRAFT_890546 [Mycena floridula]|nr:hypothetical protein C8J56DRAFT_890546 [Mycena floridula]
MRAGFHFIPPGYRVPGKLAKGDSWSCPWYQNHNMGQEKQGVEEIGKSVLIHYADINRVNRHDRILRDEETFNIGIINEDLINQLTNQVRKEHFGQMTAKLESSLRASLGQYQMHLQNPRPESITEYVFCVKGPSETWISSVDSDWIPTLEAPYAAWWLDHSVGIVEGQGPLAPQAKTEALHLETSKVPMRDLRKMQDNNDSDKCVITQLSI